MRYTRKPKGLPRVLIASVLALAIVLGSVVTAVANAVDITVYDGEDVYTFSMLGGDAESILARAETEGMKPVSDIDTYTLSESDTVLTIQRNVRVSVSADNMVQTFVVPKGTVLADALADNQVEVDELDLIEPAPETELLSDTKVEITRSRHVYVEADGKHEIVDQLEGTVADALKSAGVRLGTGDEVSPAEDTELEDGMQIVVGRRMIVSVSADGEETTAMVTAHDAEEAVLEAGIELGEDDRIYLVSDDGEELIPRSTFAYEADGVSLRVERITKEMITVDEIIEYEIVYEEIEGQFRDQTRVITNGVDGEKRVTYEVTYADGVEEGRTAVSEEILKEAVNEIVERGAERRASATGGNGTFTDHIGDVVSYQYAITGNCTAYCWNAGSITSTGETVRHGYVAVDPNIIPYGSLLYITSPDGEWNYGYCYAMDTGGAAMSGRIVADLFYDSEAMCFEFGRRKMIVYVIQVGGYHGW